MSREPRGLILAARHSEDEVSLMAGSRAPQALPIANRALIAHALESMAACGIGEVAIVVSDATAADVATAVGALTSEGPLAGLDPIYVHCERPPTLPQALVSVRDFLSGRRFLVQLGDSLVSPAIAPPAGLAAGGDDDVTVFVRRSHERQRRDGATLGGGRLRLVGNPAPPPPHQALAGIFAFGPGAIDAAEGLPPGAGRAPQVADLLAALRERGGELEQCAVGSAWKYSGEVDELLAANRMVLDDLRPEPTEAELSAARIEGRVEVHRTAVLERTTVRGPAVIGAGAVLLDSFVGPYTAVGEKVRIEGAELQYSIVLPGASIRHPGTRLEASLIGRGAKITREFELPSALKLRVGSMAEISLS